MATRKWDGTCTRLDEGGAWWARREVKPGKTAPDGFQLVQEDPVTGKKVGWEPVAQSAFAKYHAQALAIGNDYFRRGTYELLGPKVNGNPDGFEQHILIGRGWAPFSDRLAYDKAPRDYEALRTWLHARPHEGIVWHRDPHAPDAGMAKLKARDFPRTRRELTPEKRSCTTTRIPSTTSTGRAKNSPSTPPTTICGSGMASTSA
ncbi:hypothetical protein ACPCSP_25785 [Streptomyces cinereoruber]|uniref:hypothetical protein n=1 Tax=Streptomyces cinereoruber TaxID=67260 RepID=UPI003C2F8D47